MLELMRNYRPEHFAEFIADLRKMKTEVNQILKHMEQLNVENLYAGPIRPEKQSIINVCKKN